MINMATPSTSVKYLATFAGALGEIFQEGYIAENQFAVFENIGGKYHTVHSVVLVEEFPEGVTVFDRTKPADPNDNAEKGKYNDYHFSCGNSSEGAVGFCAVIRAKTPEEAVEILKAQIDESLNQESDDDQVDYITFYTNTEAISIADIDEVTESDETPEDEEEDDD